MFIATNSNELTPLYISTIDIMSLCMSVFECKNREEFSSKWMPSESIKLKAIVNLNRNANALRKILGNFSSSSVSYFVAFLFLLFSSHTNFICKGNGRIFIVVSFDAFTARNKLFAMCVFLHLNISHWRTTRKNQ